MGSGNLWKLDIFLLVVLCINLGRAVEKEQAVWTVIFLLGTLFMGDRVYRQGKNPSPGSLLSAFRPHTAAFIPQCA